MLRLKNSIGMVKECKIGFSWTTLFFGLFVPLLRGDLKNSAIMAIVGLLTCGFSWLVFPFFYNKTYVKGLLLQGFIGATEADKEILISKGFIIRDHKEEIKEATESFKKGMKEGMKEIPKIEENKEEA